MSTATYLLLAILLFIGFQFVWYGIIAPSLRLHLRYRLFRQRDVLRELTAAAEKQSMVAYEVAEQGLNSAIQLLPEMDFSLVATVNEALKKDSDLRARIEHRIAVVRECNNLELRQVDREINRVMGIALLVNVSGLLVWLVPVLVCMFVFRTIDSAVRASVAARPPELAEMGIIA